MKYSIVIPVHNEEDSVELTVRELVEVLRAAAIPYEIVLVNDNSSDRTPEIAEELAEEDPAIRVVHRPPPNGFGRAVRDGLAAATGEAICIVMGDQSDDPEDVVRYYHKLQEGWDCVFGSRFIRGAVVKDYPCLKLIINRLANWFVRVLFRVPYNDLTNAFKAYRRYVIEAVQPLTAQHFNITLEIPLKAINRGFTFATIPINWYGREAGVSKLKFREMGRKYLYTTLVCWLERRLLRDEWPTATQAGESKKIALNKMGDKRLQ